MRRKGSSSNAALQCSSAAEEAPFRGAAAGRGAFALQRAPTREMTRQGKGKRAEHGDLDQPRDAACRAAHTRDALTNRIVARLMSWPDLACERALRFGQSSEGPRVAEGRPTHPLASSTYCTRDSYRSRVACSGRIRGSGGDLVSRMLRIVISRGRNLFVCDGILKHLSTFLVYFSEKFRYLICSTCASAT